LPEALVALLVDATPHYVWSDVESVFWYLYVACLAANRPGNYAMMCHSQPRGLT
jgi:hypothetical protein